MKIERIMSATIDDTHDPGLQSWLESANDPATDFPIQNLPFGRFRRADDMDWRIGVAIGDQVLDLRCARLIDSHDMNLIMRLAGEPRQALRAAISEGLRARSSQETLFRGALLPQSGVEMGLPCVIGDYTDFYTSIHHATTVGKQFRPDNTLLPNYKWVPIGYHGRASSIAVSRRGLGHMFKRPVGQTMAPGATVPTVGPTTRMDYELELGLFILRPNVIGESIMIESAEEHVFGVALFNDWTVAQLVAYHTVNGCNLRDGDLFGSGTLSGPKPEQAGSLLEMTQGGKKAITLSNGEVRGYLEDGDTIVMKACCQRAGYRRTGFGECRGTVQAARPL